MKPVSFTQKYPGPPYGPQMVRLTSMSAPGAKCEDPGDGPGAGGGYADRIDISPWDDGPGAGGGYADRVECVPNDDDGPGAGGGYADSESIGGGDSDGTIAMWFPPSLPTVVTASYLPFSWNIADAIQGSHVAKPDGGDV